MVSDLEKQAGVNFSNFNRKITITRCLLSINTITAMYKWNTSKNNYQVYQILSGRSNVFLLSNEEKYILIDTSTEGNWDNLTKKLNNFNIHRLDYLILTHTHFDHVGNSGKIKELYNPLVIVHQSEKYLLSSGKATIPKGTNFVTHNMVKFFGNKVSPKLNFKPCNADILVDSSYKFNNIGLNAYLLHTPGHSSGSMSLIIDDEIALVGDAMVGVIPNSIYPPFADNKKQLIESWEKLSKTNCSIFIPSHGTPNKRSLLQKQINKNKKGLNL